ncbi:MAG: hypothetical protein LBK44_05485 [Spirochaetales bacterium]|jgi:hypothetical protein|nr:hypothetical protein [Spirochaetales bacterium]
MQILWAFRYNPSRTAAATREFANANSRVHNCCFSNYAPATRKENEVLPKKGTWRHISLAFTEK